MLRALIGVTLVLALVGAATIWYAGTGNFGEHQDAGEIVGKPLPAALIKSRNSHKYVPDASNSKQILFGDLHVHTTFSYDAFMQSLPLAGGSGAHPPADACDFARYCSGLDFWSINDHAEELTPQHWQEAVASIRQCNAVGQSAETPDVVAFLGWEWTQMGTTPDNHYGHKNVILRDLEDGKIPVRPVANKKIAGGLNRPTLMQRGYDALFAGDSYYHDYARMVTEVEAIEPCAAGVPVRDLPADCQEAVKTPEELFAKLDEWGSASMVIPHGTTWGVYTPPGANWRKQLSTSDPQREFLFELYSGHGNTEEYMDNAAVTYAADGSAQCPQPSKDYLPSCWRAGQIIEQRCLAANLGEDECASRAKQARQYYIDAGSGGHLSIPDATAEEWLDSGQCRDCFLPAFNYRRDNSAQAVLAIRDNTDGQKPRGFRFGFIGSSDNHSARPGAGYKEFGIGEMSDGSRGGRSAYFDTQAGDKEKLLEAQPVTLESFAKAGARAFEVERVVPFLYSGGLVAVHSGSRDRNAIWDAMQKREVYATSGPRILLWFDAILLENNMRIPMGGELSASVSPEFRVKALGSLEQKPGCPAFASQGLNEKRLKQLCLGECDNPSDTRRAITRIEVIRIRPQQDDEPLGTLIDSPWRSFDCSKEELPAAGCEVSFTDPDFSSEARDTVYYVRAIEEPGQAINAANLGCERDADGQCLRTVSCMDRPDAGPDCLAPVEERAWSSPIFVDYHISQNTTMEESVNGSQPSN